MTEFYIKNEQGVNPARFLYMLLILYFEFSNQIC